MHLLKRTITWLSTLRQVLENGGPSCCHFAVTSICNAGCEFCNFSTRSPQQVDRVHIPVEDACAALDVLAANGIGYVVFTGGEPTTHPDMPSLLSRAKQLGIITTLCTNGWLLTADHIKQYVDAGLASVVISVDAPNAEAHEANRNLPGICSRIADANILLRDLKVQTAASVTISRLIGDLDELPQFLRSLNFDNVTFSYPQRWLPSTYKVFSDSYLINYTADELWSAFNSIKGIKNKLHVLNPSTALDEMQRFIRGEEQRFACLGGYKQFYLDWHLNMYRCFAWPEPISSVWEFGAGKLVRDGCVNCMSDCFRDTSVMHYAGIALHDATRSLLRGHLRTSLRQLANRTVYQSVRSLAEQRSWVRGLHRHR